MVNAASAVDAPQVFKSTFNSLINEGRSISVDIEWCQSAQELALSKMDFAIGAGSYMLPNNLNVNKGKTAGYTNKILITKQT